MATFREPIRGWTIQAWTYNRHGLTGIAANVLIGLMRTHHGDSSVKLDFVLGDTTASGIIASVWDIANNPRNDLLEIIFSRLNQIKILEKIKLNYVSNDNPITLGEFIEMILKYGKLIPSGKAVWCHSLISDKISAGLSFLRILSTFTTSSCNRYDRSVCGQTAKCNFTNKRWNELMRKSTPEDRKLFFCDMRDIVWSNYFSIYFPGIRKYILKDPIETLPQGRIKWRSIETCHHLCLSYHRMGYDFETTCNIRIFIKTTVISRISISMIDRSIFVYEISIIFNIAATVMFNQKMNSTSINVKSLNDAINSPREISKLKVLSLSCVYLLMKINYLLRSYNEKPELKKSLLCSIFQSFVHVIIAFANCLHNPIEKKFYGPPMDANNFVLLNVSNIEICHQLCSFRYHIAYNF
ncbi:LOW QUALITY PROTEIN: fatty acyl-CoA reductase wat-like isoform X2 [Vespula squamosa]|uniref:Fatty acyl-CoA reductase wat-like isoform X2 n=1 Tax=Vespula squamosa TaxID=30214 RepID=A0ABD2C942_VESSQ